MNKNTEEKAYCVIDLETTGLKVSEAEIIEICAIKITNGEIDSEFCELIKPSKPIPSEISLITHITNQMVENARYIDDVLHDFLLFIQGSVLIGHNIKAYDMKILERISEDNGYYLDNPVIDTLQMARERIDGLYSHKLDNICRCLNIKQDEKHRARPDCIATFQCYQLLCKSDKITVTDTQPSYSYRSTNYTNETKLLQELTVIFMDIVSDGQLSLQELDYLTQWLNDNDSLCGNYPFDRICKTIESILEDGRIDDNEISDLLKIINGILNPASNDDGEFLPSIDGFHFCLTGEFSMGERSSVSKIIKEHSGIVDNGVLLSTNYLIVGERGSASWKCGTYGSKIKKAFELQEKGGSIKIIGEHALTDFLNK